jgi:hypothetical protein
MAAVTRGEERGGWQSRLAIAILIDCVPGSFPGKGEGRERGRALAQTRARVLSRRPV